MSGFIVFVEKNMEAKNLISVYQGNLALENLGLNVNKGLKMLRSHEIRNLGSLCALLKECGCELKHFDGFYVSYSIEQIGKEFDYLRFGNDFILNIEAKSELKVANKKDKILKQMRINHYYLNFLLKPIKIYTYVENDGFYEYDAEADSLLEIDATVVAKSMAYQEIDYSFDPSKEFIPSNYLVSPFNSTDKFMNNEYFLTSAQQRIKDEIITELNDNPFTFFCISANAGTGKTLLLYDIAKEFISIGKKTLIIHCGKLNAGHCSLKNNYKWSVLPIKEVLESSFYSLIDECDCIFVDETQRIRTEQLEVIIKSASKKRIPVIFSFDVKQYLKTGETCNIGDYLKEKHKLIPYKIKRLTTKIRTNKEIASFITNMFEIGKSHDHLNYKDVSVEFFSDMDDLKEYLCFLKNNNWVSITYTPSQYNSCDPYRELCFVSDKTAHDVIGQEFPKVMLVMDDNFKYSENGRLSVRKSYYSAEGMLYQIVTRVVDKLKIIVYNNEDLYAKLLEIKEMGE